MREKALIIEDDHDLVELLKTHIEYLGYDVEFSYNGEDGLEKALNGDYTFVLLDYMLPGLEGVEVCRRLRAENSRVAIIMLTSKTDDLNKVLLLELGADDYITKPFNLMELKARIKAVVRRTAAPGGAFEEEQSKPLSFKGLQIDFEKRKVTLHGQTIELTTREFDLLALLAAHPGKPFTREQLNEGLYGYPVQGYERSINTHINRIRAKIEANPEEPMYVHTLRGVGYSFADLEDDPEE